ncbi:acireductone dioxygenase [Paenibacillus yanchengensis]|uniref:Acireductone dioxygenase n=1 Tax=Paenibacillus yanchengensis TaxID=2035833 RepID=A0ABW4YPW0_9BACL
MAEIKIRNTGERITGEQNVRSFLDTQEVLYEHWDASKLPTELQNKFVLSDEEKQQVLATFDSDIRDLAARRGYQTWDIITLSDETPNLDELLKKFENVHTHTEDEVRAITAGKGIFIIKGTKDVGYFDVELEAGDVISVPEHKPHFFTLMDNRQIVAVRLFIETEGWIAHPFADPQFESKN